MIKKQFSKVIYLAALAVLGMLSPLIAQERDSILSCKFGASCNNADCADYDLWLIVRHYPQEGRYAIYTVASGGPEFDVELTELDHMMVFHGTNDVQRSPERGTNSTQNTLSIAENKVASLQYSFFIEFEIDDWRFYSGQHRGICREIE